MKPAFNRPSVAQGCLIAGSGILLSVVGCFGSLASIGGSSIGAAASPAPLLMFLGIFVAVIGIVELGFFAVRGLFRTISGRMPPSDNDPRKGID